MSTNSPQVFKATQNDGYKGERDFSLFAKYDLLCGYFDNSPANASKGFVAGMGGGSSDGLLGLAILVVAWLVTWGAFATWALATGDKNKKREERLQQLDPLGHEFLQENRSNFCISSEEVECIVFTRSPHFYSGKSIRPNQMQVQLRNGTQRKFTFSDAQTARTLGARLAESGFKIESAG